MPLAIRLITGQKSPGRSLDFAVTMRSPGDDESLIMGYLYSEGIIHAAADIRQIELVSQEAANVYLKSDVRLDPNSYQRVGYANSSCGLCGKADLQQLQQTIPYFPASGQPQVSPETLRHLPKQLQEHQQLFAETGGIHATALFDSHGKLLKLTEDVGRHNALDKLLGHTLAAGPFPWRQHIVLLSGRISYELVQKAAMAGTPILAAIGAPSSAAIGLAEATGMTLVGFLRENRMNVYTHMERLTGRASV